MDKARNLVARVKNFIASLDDESDFFLPMKYFLVVGAVYIPTQDAFYRRLFVGYRILVGIQFFVWIDRVYVALFEWKNRGDLIGVNTFFLALVMILARAGLIYCYLGKLQAVCAYLGRQLNENRTGRRNRAYRLMRRIAVGLEVTFIMDQIMFYVFGVHRDRMYCTPDNIRRMDWRVKMFFVVTNASYNFVFCSIYVMIITVLTSLLMAFDLELEEVVLRFEGIFERVDLKMKELVGKDNPLTRQSMIRENLENTLFWNILENELNSVVIRHSEVLDQLGTMGEFFKLIFILMYYMEIVVLGCASFYINSQGLTFNTFIVGSYAVAHLLECYWFCRLVDNLNDTNNRIGIAVYSLDWHQRLQNAPCSAKMYRKIRTSLLTIMSKSQQNLGITCGGMFEMSAEAFQRLVNMIYNFLMFLMNTTGTTQGQ